MTGRKELLPSFASIDSLRARFFSVLLLVLFVVPTIGLANAFWLGLNNEVQFRQETQTQYFLTSEQFESRFGSYEMFCKDLAQKGEVEQRTARCAQSDEVWRLGLASVGAMACGVLLLELIFGARVLAGTNPRRMALVFGPLIRIVMLVLAASIVLQAGLINYLFYTVESVFISHANVYGLGAIGLGAIIACFLLIEQAVSYVRLSPMLLRGVILERETQATIYATVEEIATKLGAPPPDQIVAGLAPNFFVTAGEVKLAGTNLLYKGRTLFVSLGLMRLLDRAEFKSVVGHELGHFRGQDAEYSLKFAPTYARLSKSLRSMTPGGNSAISLARLPAYFALWAVLFEFALAERKVGRDRELLADKAGVEASDAQALARALVKVSVFGDLWDSIVRTNVDALSKGRQYRNLSALYAEHCEHVGQSVDWEHVRLHMGSYIQPHPVDTHPPLGERLQALGMSLDAMKGAEIQTPLKPSIELVTAWTDLEEELTILENRFLVETKAAKLPDKASANCDATSLASVGTKSD